MILQLRAATTNPGRYVCRWQFVYYFFLNMMPRSQIFVIIVQSNPTMFTILPPDSKDTCWASRFLYIISDTSVAKWLPFKIYLIGCMGF